MEEIKGTVYDIIFYNEENSYAICRFESDTHKDLITVVGVMPYITEEQYIKASGEWVQHQKFGKQFKVEYYEEIVPESTEGIQKYLGSGIIEGIGPKLAERIVKHFGEKTLEIMDNDINKLSEIPGIGERKLETIKQSYEDKRNLKEVMMFLQECGLSLGMSGKICAKYGVGAINAIRENPYRLVSEIEGVGFLTADRIAREVGIEQNSPFRIKSGMQYTLNNFCMEGSTYMPYDRLVDESAKLLEVTKEEVEKSIYEAGVERIVKVEEVDGEKAVFAMIFYYSELNITNQMVQMASNVVRPIDLDYDEEISEFEEENGITFGDRQKEAIKGAMENNIEIITGGPGTGKTTIMKCIVSMFEKVRMKVGLAAPTGRAAKRMTESTGLEAKTIHRLLDVKFAEDDLAMIDEETNEIEYDVLIIDEASMIDIFLMSRLVKAANPSMRIIIVGDVDQLPSVGPGCVLRDLIESNAVKVVRLDKIFRQSGKSMIVENAHKINNGEIPVVNQKGTDFFILKEDNTEKVVDTIIELIQTRLPKFNKKWDRMEDIQILSPMKKGNVGVLNLNERIQDVLNPAIKGKRFIDHNDTSFRVGDKVMQIKNNYSLRWENVRTKDAGEGIFNGDIGYIQDVNSDKGIVVVRFEDDKVVKYEKAFLKELTLAYAVTVHKSQGCEFPVVIMPVCSGPELLLNRNLLYTGVTRAKQMVVLVGSERYLASMVKNDRSYKRYSSLGWRIRDLFEE